MKARGRSAARRSPQTEHNYRPIGLLNYYDVRIALTREGEDAVLAYIGASEKDPSRRRRKVEAILRGLLSADVESILSEAT